MSVTPPRPGGAEQPSPGARRASGRPAQLEMVWPARLRDAPPDAQPPPGYTLRTYRRGDEPAFFALLSRAGFPGWDEDRLRPVRPTLLPDGWFFVEHDDSGEVVATAMAQHSPSAWHPRGGELGWVAGHPAHAGRGLGRAVCARATARLLAADVDEVYLKTDDFRLPAISVYLLLGYVPLLFAGDMPRRWARICAELGWPYDPADWAEGSGRAGGGVRGGPGR